MKPGKSFSSVTQTHNRLCNSILIDLLWNIAVIAMYGRRILFLEEIYVMPKDPVSQDDGILTFYGFSIY